MLTRKGSENRDRGRDPATEPARARTTLDIVIVRPDKMSTDAAETVLASAISPEEAASRLEDLKVDDVEAGSDSDEGEGDGQDAAPIGSGQAGAAPKKKKKKPKKKKAANKDAGGDASQSQTPAPNAPAAKAKPSARPTQQTEPPTVPVSHLFPDHVYPEGQLQEYADKLVSLPRNLCARSLTK